MTTPTNDSSNSSSAADASATASSPGSASGDSNQVASTGGMAAGSEGTGADTGLIDDDQLPEELRPDAEGLSGDDPKERSMEGATEQAGQMAEPSQGSPEDESDVSEPTG